MKKLGRLFMIFAIAFLLITTFNNSFAIDIKESLIVADINPDEYKPSDPSLAEDSSVKTIAGKIIGGLQGIGSIVSVLVLVIAGVKYMISSVEEKAEYKQKFIYYVVGSILVFSVSNISALIYNWAKDL